MENYLPKTMDFYLPKSMDFSLPFTLSSLGDDSKLEAEKVNIEKTSSDERVFVIKAGDFDESKD
jgi:hypothetical protein